MDFLPFITDTLKYTIAGLLVFFTAWYIIKDYLQFSSRARDTELKKNALSHTLPLRLQAYERIVLFLERINPANLLIRLHATGMTVRELHQLVLSDIRAEYQHNLSQQLYVGHDTWEIVKRLKEDTIGLVNNAAGVLPPDAASVELSKAILTHLAELEHNPYEAGLLMIKNEMQRLF